MKPPEKLRQIAIELHTMMVAESLTTVEASLTHHWRDADDEPQSRKCNIKISGDVLYITWVIERSPMTIYQGPVTWLYGVRRYDEEEISD